MASSHVDEIYLGLTFVVKSMEYLGVQFVIFNFLDSSFALELCRFVTYTRARAVTP